MVRAGGDRSAARQRPQSVPFAVAFAGLVAAEELYLGWLVWAPEPGVYWFVLAAVALAGLSLAGAVLVWRGRPRAWLVLAGASTVPLLFLLGLALYFGTLGGGRAVWWALLMLAGPLGCLVLSAGEPIRAWTAPRASDPSPSRRRRRAGAR